MPDKQTAMDCTVVLQAEDRSYTRRGRQSSQGTPRERWHTVEWWCRFWVHVVVLVSKPHTDRWVVVQPVGELLRETVRKVCVFIEVCVCMC